MRSIGGWKKVLRRLGWQQKRKLKRRVEQERRRHLFELLEPRQMMVASLSVQDVTVNEGNVANFVVALSEPTDSDVTVDYGEVDSSAVAGQDYVSSPGTLTFAAGGWTASPSGDWEQTVSVSTLAGGRATPNEQFQFVLSNPSGADLDTSLSSAMGTITNIVANADSLSSVIHDHPLTFAASALLGNDTDADGESFQVSHWTQPANGTLAQNGDGSFTYTPDHGFVGTDSFTYEAGNGIANSNDATVSIAVTNTAQPVANNDNSYSTVHNCAVDGSVFTGGAG